MGTRQSMPEARNIEKLKSFLEIIKNSNPDALHYACSMWSFTFNHIYQADEQVPRSDQCDAIPYVPLIPETFNCRLSEESVFLDIGCLGGYGMFDFVTRRKRQALCVPKMIGLDLPFESVVLGKLMAEHWIENNETVNFIQGSACALPLESKSCDLITSRLVLPYVSSISAALQEIGRVLRKEGLVCLQTHSFKYYINNLRNRQQQWRRSIYYLRPLLSGSFLAITGRQAPGRRFRETAMSANLLTRSVKKFGLQPVDQIGFDTKPIVVLRKC